MLELEELVLLELLRLQAQGRRLVPAHVGLRTHSYFPLTRGVSVYKILVPGIYFCTSLISCLDKFRQKTKREGRERGGREEKEKTTLTICRSREPQAHSIFTQVSEPALLGCVS